MISKDCIISAGLRPIQGLQGIVAGRQKSVVIALGALALIAGMFASSCLRSYSLKILLKIIPDPIKRLLFPPHSNTELLLQLGLQHSNIERILENFSQLPATCQLETLVKCAKAVLPNPRQESFQETYTSYLSTIIECLVTRPDFENIATLALRLSLSIQNARLVIMALCQVPQERMEKIVDLTLSISSIHRVDIPGIITDLQSAEMPEHVKRIIDLYHPYIHKDSLNDFCKQLTKVSSEKLFPIAEEAFYFFKDGERTGVWYADVIVEALNKAEDHTAVFNAALLLINKDPFWHETQSELIKALSEVPMENLEKVKTAAYDLFSSCPKSYNNLNRASIIYRLSKRADPQALADATLVIASSRIKENLEGLLISLSYLPPQILNNAHLYDRLLPLMQPDFSNNVRKDIINSLRQIPEAFLVEELNTINAQLQAEAAPGVEVRYTRVIELIENRALALRLPPLHAGAGAAAGGVNVHSGERELKTKQMLLLLKSNQGDLSSEEIATEVREFKEYLKAHTNIPEKGLAHRALEGPKKGSEPYGPLLPDDTFTICGYAMPGPEVIARMWRFCKSYTEEGIDNGKERENAKHSMITALSMSYEDGDLVCNPGKVQRLCTSVLQGRLPGVDIDELASAIIRKEDVARMFFTPKRQGLQTRAELILAAEEFCRDNTSVNKDELLAIINGYATESGIE